MALKILDRVKETTSTTGTSDLTLDGAVTGFQSFSAIGDGNSCYYVLVDGTAWETGIGTYTLSTNTLARTTVLSSSDSGSKLTLAAGSKEVWIDAPAGMFEPPVRITNDAIVIVADIDRIVVCTYSGAAVTLPPVVIGQKITVKNYSGGAVSWNLSYSDTIDGSAFPSSLADTEVVTVLGYVATVIGVSGGDWITI